MKKTLASLRWIESLILVVIFIAMVAAIFFQVVNRNILQLPIPWLEEVAVYCMIYLVLLGTEAGLRDGSQISITLIQDRFSGRARLAIEVAAKIVVVAFAGFMTMAAFNLVMQQVNSGQTSPALKVPMWLPFGAFLVAFGLILIVQVVVLGVLVVAFVRFDESLAATVEPHRDGLDALAAEGGVLRDDPNPTIDGGTR